MTISSAVSQKISGHFSQEYSFREEDF